MRPVRTGAPRQWWTPALLWLLLALAGVLVILHALIPGAVLLPYLGIVVVLGALVLSPRSTLVLGVVSLLFVGLSAVLDDGGDPVNSLLRVIAMAMVGGLAVALATARARSNEARDVALAELQRQQQDYRNLAENSADFVLSTTPDRIIDWISPSVTQVLGWEREEVIGRPARQFVHPDSYADVERAVALVDAGKVGGGRARVLQADGGYRWMDHRSRPVFDEAGLVVRRVSGWRDVEAEVEAQQRLAESELRYRLLAENTSDVVMRTRDNVVVWVSGSLTTALDWSPEEWIGHSLAEFGHPGDLPQVERARTDMNEGRQVILRVRLKAKPGDYRWVELHSQRYEDEEGNADGFQSSFRTIDAEVLAEAELLRRATYDDLTGALKRDGAIRRLTALENQQRAPGAFTAALFVDVDRFKVVNDTWGHVVGDTLLLAIAERFRTTLRSGDILARMGGDEFLVILEALHGLDDAVSVADKLRRQAAEPLHVGQELVTATVSIGVTMCQPTDTAEDILARADAAMFAAKEAGRNRVFTMASAEGDATASVGVGEAADMPLVVDPGDGPDPVGDRIG